MHADTMPESPDASSVKLLPLSRRLNIKQTLYISPIFSKDASQIELAMANECDTPFSNIFFNLSEVVGNSINCASITQPVGLRPDGSLTLVKDREVHPGEKSEILDRIALIEKSISKTLLDLSNLRAEVQNR